MRSSGDKIVMVTASTAAATVLRSRAAQKFSRTSQVRASKANTFGPSASIRLVT